MAEHNDPQEPTLPSKRKSDSDIQDLPSKIPNLDLKETTQQPNPTANDDTSQLPNSSSSEPVNDDKDLQNDNDENQLQNDEEEGQEEDRKGKGISRDDKGKGKMIVQEDDADDDDSDDDSDSDDDDDSDGSDFSDDPLTEVDLNNILPSRTRGRTASAGVRIAGDAANATAAVGGDDDDDDSDDSDA